MDEYSKKAKAAKALGLTQVKSNYIKHLWKVHCSEVHGLDFTSGVLYENEEDILHREEIIQSDENQLLLILETINTDPTSWQLDDIKNKKHWLDQKLIMLERIKSHIELRLRNTSSHQKYN